MCSAPGPWVLHTGRILKQLLARASWSAIVFVVIWPTSKVVGSWGTDHPEA